MKIIRNRKKMCIRDRNKLGPPKPNLDITQQNYKTDRPASSKKNCMFGDEPKQ